MKLIVVHSAVPTLSREDMTGGHNHAHAFGPYDSLEEISAVEATYPDHCHKFILELVADKDGNLHDPSPRNFEAARYLGPH